MSFVFNPDARGHLKCYVKGRSGKSVMPRLYFELLIEEIQSVPWNWWSDASEGGGALGAIASHVIDSFHWFLGTQTSTVTCQLQTHIKERRDNHGQTRLVTSDDESNMLLRFRDGELTTDATGLASVSMCEHPRYENSLEFFGEKGAMRIHQNGVIDIASIGEEDWTRIDVKLGKSVPGVPDTGFAAGVYGICAEISFRVGFGPHLRAACRNL